MSGSEDQAMAKTPVPVDYELAVVDTQMANNTQFILDSMQKESLNFLEYKEYMIFQRQCLCCDRFVKNKLLDHRERDGACNALAFTDIVEPAKTTAFVAAQVH